MSRLIDAARDSKTRVLRRLLEDGEEPNQRDAQGITALMWAQSRRSERKSATMTEDLLAAGADVEAEDNWGRTALGWAALHGNEQGVRLLLAAGADPERSSAASEDEADRGRTALMWAAQADSTRTAALLIEAGASAAKRDARGMSARDYARRLKSLGGEKMERLLAVAEERESLDEEPRPARSRERVRL